MCADCGCGCKKGKPEKGCKCDCKTCSGARHESAEGAKHEKAEVEKFFLEASEILKAASKKKKEGFFSPKNKKYARNVVLTDTAAGLTVGGGGLAGSGINAYNAKKGRKAAVFGRTYGRSLAEGIGGIGAGGALGAGIGALTRKPDAALKGAMIGSGIGVAGGSGHGMYRATKNAQKRGDFGKSAFFAEDIDKAFNPMGAVNALKSAGSALKTGFKSGKMFGNAGIKNAVSPFGGANAAQKVKTAGFKAGNVAGRAGNYAKANPLKTAGIAGGAGLAGGMAIKKSQGVSAFGVDHNEYFSKALTGTPGDKRNTKYAGAAYGGALAGGLVARNIAAGGPKKLKEIKSGINAAGRSAAASGSNFKGIMSAVKGAPGASKIFRANRIGAVTGAVLGAGAYARHRKNK